MAIFEDVTLGWKGQEKTIPADKIMRLIAKIEDEITLQELSSESGVKLSKVSFAYAVALNYAGFSVTPDEVWATYFNGDSAAQSVVDAISSLQMLMLPPETYRPKSDPKPQPKARKKKRR